MVRGTLDRMSVPETELPGASRAYGSHSHTQLDTKINVAPTIRDLARAVLPPPVLRRDILAALNNRVGWSAIQHWEKGRRRVPQWAIDALLSRAAAPAQIAAQLSTNKNRRAELAAQSRAYWARRARERDAQKEKGGT